jgi:NAD(P)-dependent dehydrogenase (short-subunit alcohol dehydrogenase family)
MRFSGKKVFVSGASRGIGKAIAAAFKEEGAWVIGTCTSDPPNGDDICQEWYITDFTDTSQINECAFFLKKTQPDILINNAGINKIDRFLDISTDDFLEIQQVNVLAPLLLCQAAIPSMIKKGCGRIVNISSVWGKISKEYRASYSCSKFALDGMTLALTAEHAADGIIANSIAPGFIDTELTLNILGEKGLQKLTSLVPAKRPGQVDEIARFVLWLSSEENTYVAGQNISIDGGFSRV